MKYVDPDYDKLTCTLIRIASGTTELGAELSAQQMSGITKFCLARILVTEYAADYARRTASNVVQGMENTETGERIEFKEPKYGIN